MSKTPLEPCLTQEAPIKKPKSPKVSKTKQLTICAMLCALSVVLARFFGAMPNDFTRFSIEAVPTILAGIYFGPIAGALVGFSADFIGCLFSAFGYNPLFCLPPILYGLSGGFFGPWLRKAPQQGSFVTREAIRILKLAAALLVPVVLGSILYQSFALGLMYGKGETLFESWVLFLSTRSIQFAVTWAVDVVLVYLLQKSGVFKAARLE